MTEPSPDDLVRVDIVGLDMKAWQDTAEHHDELFREFALILSRDATPGHDVPSRLLALVEELGARYAGFGLGAQQALDEAVAMGTPMVDLHYDMPRAVRDDCVHFEQLLAEADDYCRQGELLTLAPPPESIAFRNWFLEEFVRQIDGEPPMTWADYLEAHSG